MMAERTTHWASGDLVLRTEVIGLLPAGLKTLPLATNRGVWEGRMVYVVEDSPDELITFIPSNSELGFVDGDWPTEDGTHPWSANPVWQGHGCLMIQRPEDHYAIWHFWTGPDRDFSVWYLNLQTAFQRTASGMATHDLELDIVVFPDGSHIVKDDEKLDDSIALGMFTQEHVDWIRSYGHSLVERLESDGPWWDTSWADWEPPANWTATALPAGWADPNS